MKKPFRIDYEKIKRNLYHDLYELNDYIDIARADLEKLRAEVTKQLLDDIDKKFIETPDAVASYAKLAKVLEDMEARKIDSIKVIHDLYEQEDRDKQPLQTDKKKDVVLPTDIKNIAEALLVFSQKKDVAKEQSA